MYLGLQSLTPEKLKQAFKGHSLEPLIRVMVEIEIAERSGGGAPEGPSPPSVNDRGRDGEWSSKRALPEDAATFGKRKACRISIIADTRKVLWSCKTNETLEKVRGDFKEEAAAPQPRARALLNAGARFVAITTSVLLPAAPTDPDKHKSAKERLRDELIDRYVNSTTRTRSQLKRQIEVLDGNDLVSMIRAWNHPRLSAEFGEQLGAKNWPLVNTYQSATKALVSDRGGSVDFISDDSRKRAIEGIRSMMGESDDQIVLVTGAPGVGKTRCVIEAVRAHPDRVLFVDGDESARSCLKEGVLASAPGALLVVDDVSSENANILFQAFSAARSSHPGAQLIAICPSAEKPVARQSHRHIEIKPLDEAQARQLVASLLSDLDRIDVVVRLTQGYPWFAVLVAREMKEGSHQPTLITTIDAAKIAIAGLPDRHDALIHKAKLLLAVMLTHGGDWPGADDDERTRLAHAVDLPDRRVLDTTLRQCVERGIVRKGVRYYVTPFVLEREVWNIFRLKDPNDPMHSGARMIARIRRHTPHLVEPLLARLPKLGVESLALSALSDALARELAREVTSVDSLSDRATGSLTRFCARYSPARTASWLPRLVSSAPEDLLRSARRARQPVVRALEEIARQGVEFASVEDALFTLRVNEIDGFSDNASETWVMLFSAPLAAVPVPIDRRLDVLEARCMRPASIERRTSALNGIQTLLDSHSSVTLRAGAPPLGAPRAEETKRARARMVTILLRGSMDPAVAAVAQGIFVRVVREILGDLVIVDVDELQRALRSFGEVPRTALRTVLAELSDPLFDDARNVITALDEATRPAGDDYRQRLLDHLGQPHHAMLERERFDRRSEQLALEGLSAPGRPLLQCSDVLSLEVAQHRIPFCTTVGQADADVLVLPRLTERTVRQPDANSLSAYLLGHVLAGRVSDVVRWIRTWTGDDLLRTAALVSIARAHDTPEMMALAPTVLASGPIPSGALRFFCAPPWRGIRAVDREAVLRALIEHQGVHGSLAALDQLGSYHHTHKALPANQRDVLLRILERLNPAGLSQLHDDQFERLVTWLLAVAADEAVQLVLAVATMAAPVGPDVTKALRLVLDRGSAGFWGHALRVLARQDDAAHALRSHLHFARVGDALPEQEILAWIGSDATRGRWIAGIVSVDQESLPRVAAEIIRRFGARSEPADDLIEYADEGASSFDGAVVKYATLVRHAREWAAASTGEVHTWALLAAERFERHRAWHAAFVAARRDVGT